MSADALLGNLASSLVPETKKFMCRKLGTLLKVFTEKEDCDDFPEVSVESFQVLQQALFTQLEFANGKENANIRNDLASLLLVITKEKKGLRTEFGPFAMKIGQFVSENVLGSDSPAFPLSSRPLDIQLLKIFTHLLRLVLKAHSLPEDVVDSWCLVESGIVMLIGPCPLLDTVMGVTGDEGIIHAAWELLRTIARVSPTAFAQDEGLGAILSYLDVYATAGGGKLNMNIIAIFLDILRSLSTNHPSVREYLQTASAVTTLVGVLGTLSGHDWEVPEDAALSNLLFTIATLCDQNDAQQTLFLEKNGVKILLRLLNRLIYAPPHKRHMDSLLGICVGECIWRCLGSCASSLETFLGFEGMFRLLDFLEISESRGSQLKLLTALLDLCEYPRCLDQVLYWKRRLPQVRDNFHLPETSLGDEVGTRVQGQDLSLGALLCELWRKEEVLMEVARSKEGLISNLESPLMSAMGRESKAQSQATLDLLYSHRPKIYLMAKKITEATNTEATLFGGLSPKSQVTMELIIHFMDLKRGELWLEMVGSLGGIPVVAADAAALEKYTRISKNKAMAVLDTQQFLLCRDHEQKLIQERELHLKIRETELQDHFLGVREAEERARTSCYPLLVDKRLWQRAQLAKARVETASSFKPGAKIHLTTNQDLNLTHWLEGRTKVVDSEEMGFQEESKRKWKEEAGEGVERQEEEEPIKMMVTEAVTPAHDPLLPTEATRSLDESPGLSPKEGVYEINPEALSKALKQALNDEKKWNWKSGEEAWSLRTKWKSTWYH